MVKSCIFIQVIKNALVCIPFSFQSLILVPSLILNQKHSKFFKLHKFYPLWYFQIIAFQTVFIEQSRERKIFNTNLRNKEKNSDNILIYIQVSTTPCLHKTYMCHVGCLLVGRWGWSHSISCRILDSGPCIFHKNKCVRKIQYLETEL